MLAYLATAIAAVLAWEVARVLLRAARPVPSRAAPAAPPPPSEVDDARPEVAARMAPGASDGDGWTAFRFVCHGDTEGVVRLSPARRAWLHALTESERAALCRCMPGRIGGHLDRQTTIRGVRHVAQVQPIVTLRDLVERASGGGGGPRRPR